MVGFCITDNDVVEEASKKEIVRRYYNEQNNYKMGLCDEDTCRKVKLLMNELNIDGSRCHLNGPSSNIQQEYMNSSIFAFTSRFEGFGMVLVEAMSCGLPVISFDCPCGPHDIITDDEDGLLVQNGNVSAYVHKLSLLMDDASLRQRMSTAGRKNVERFKMEHIGDSWKKLFEGLYE